MANQTFDPFRELDRLFNAAARPAGSATLAMPMDLYRDGDVFTLEIDLPGVDPGSIDIDVEDRSLTIRAERKTRGQEGVQWFTHERPSGTFARQLTLGHGLATDRIEAAYADGVLTLTIPVAEQAKPRKIQVAHKPVAASVEAGETPETVDSVAHEG